MDTKTTTTVIDLNDVPEMSLDESDHFGHIQDSSDNYGKRNEKPNDFLSSIKSSVSTYMWQETRQHAQSAFKSYGNIDYLRPYFDVETHEVGKRLLFSFFPTRIYGRSEVPAELYGPTMICFTLVALLLFEMKLSDHQVREGTLMGSAILTCFGYWFGVSGLFCLLAYVCKTGLRPIQILSLIGYSLTGHCVVMFFSTILHPSSNNDHLLFYFMWLLCGGLCAFRLVTALVTHTKGHTERLILSILLVLCHMLYLLYLHFAYHKIMADLSEILDQPSKFHKAPSNTVFVKPVLNRQFVSTQLNNLAAV